MTLRKIATLAAGLALAGAPAAAAHHGTQPQNHGKAKGHAKALIAYVAKGTVKAVDPTAKTLTLTVPDRKGATNHHARAWRGTDVTFDLSHARLVVRDVNGDGHRDLADVAVGDSARVLAKLPRTLSGSGPFAAKRVVVHHRTAH